MAVGSGVGDAVGDGSMSRRRFRSRRWRNSRSRRRSRSRSRRQRRSVSRWRLKSRSRRGSIRGRRLKSRRRRTRRSRSRRLSRHLRRNHRHRRRRHIFAHTTRDHKHKHQPQPSQLRELADRQSMVMTVGHADQEQKGIEVTPLSTRFASFQPTIKTLNTNPALRRLRKHESPSSEPVPFAKLEGRDVGAVHEPSHPQAVHA